MKNSVRLKDFHASGKKKRKRRQAGRQASQTQAKGSSCGNPFSCVRPGACECDNLRFRPVHDGRGSSATKCLSHKVDGLSSIPGSNVKERLRLWKLSCDLQDDSTYKHLLHSTHTYIQSNNKHDKRILIHLPLWTLGVNPGASRTPGHCFTLEVHLQSHVCAFLKLHWDGWCGGQGRADSFSLPVLGAKEPLDSPSA